MNIKELARKAADNVLAGSYVYEYAFYPADNTLACLGYCNIVADESKYIDPVSESPQIYDLSDSVDFTTVIHCVMNDGDVDLATLNISFINNGTCNGISYTEKDKSVLKKIKPDGEECINIQILLKAESKTSEGNPDTRYKLYTSKDTLDICIPSNKTTYFYIIVYANGTLPSIIATDKRIGENSYRDIKPYIFERNIRPGVYNSYFHPHSYIINDITEYSNNVVYGAPISELELDQRFTFTEEVQDYGNVFKYVNNIGITCTKEANVINAMYDSFSTSDHEYSVELNGITIATYKDDNKYKLSINNLKLFNDISDYGIFEPLMKSDFKISFSDLKTMYGINNREFGDVVNNKIEFEKIEKKIDGNVYFRNETISEDSNITKRYVLCIHDNQRMIEYLYYYKDEVTNESSVTYTAFINEYTMQIFCPTMDKFTTQLFSGDKRNMHINNMFYDYCCSIQDVIEVLGNTVSIRGKKGSNVNQNTLQLDEIGLSKYNMFGVPDQF